MHLTDPELAESLRDSRSYRNALSLKRQTPRTSGRDARHKATVQRNRRASPDLRTAVSRQTHDTTDRTEGYIAHEDESERSETDTSDAEDSFPCAHATRALFVSAHIIVKESIWLCAHRYEVDFHLVRQHSKTKIGELVCHVVECDATGPRNQPLSIDELLTPRKGERLSEVQNILRALFTNRGRLRKGLERYKDALGGEKILVVDTFRLDRPYRGTGLAQDAIAAFLDGLKKVKRVDAEDEDEDWTFDGAVVLSPAADETEKRKLQKSGRAVDDVVVEKKLITSWEKSGFEVWVLGDEAVEGSVSVMGRAGGQDSAKT